MHRGYIKLFRRVMDNPIVTKDPEYFTLWIYLLLHATFGGSDIIFQGKRLHLEPGQLFTGRIKLSNDLKIGESKIQRILKAFEKDKQIEQQMSNNGRVITIVNREEYQGSYQDDENLNNKGTSDELQSNTIKEFNNEKNERIKLDKLKNLNSEIDQLIVAVKRKCEVYQLIYNPAQERRFGHNILKPAFKKKIAEMGFDSPLSFVETIIDMSMQKGNWWNHKIAGLKDIHRNYPKVYAGYKSAQLEDQSIPSF